MRKIFCITILVLVHYFSMAQDTMHAKAKFKAGNQIAREIADKMYVLLALSKKQQTEVLQVNLDLQNQKKEAFRLSGDRTNLQERLQRIESSRDSLYATVLTSQQLARYKQKKKYVVSIN